MTVFKCKEQRPYVLRESGGVWVFDNNGELYPASHADILDLTKPIFEDEFLNMFESEKEQAIAKYKQENESLRIENAFLISEKSKLEIEIKYLNKLISEKDEELITAHEAIEQIPIPSSGIEVVESKGILGKWTHTLRDLRNDRKYYERTWENTTGIHHYAISEHENFLLTNEVPYKAMESRTMPGIWVEAKVHAEHWKYNFYDMRGNKKKIYYSVVGDSLEGIWQEFVNDYHSRKGENQTVGENSTVDESSTKNIQIICLENK